MQITLRSVEDVLAALPPLLGFAPSDSLVVFGMKDENNKGVFSRSIRIDLQALSQPGFAEYLAHVIDQSGITHYVSVVVQDTDDDELPHRHEVRAVSRAVKELTSSEGLWLHLPAFVAGATWSDYHRPLRTGTLPDPATTSVAAAATVEGRRTYSSRDELRRQFVPAPADTRLRVLELTAPIARAVELEEITDDRAALSRRLDEIDTAITAATRGELPDDDTTVARLIAALNSVTLRDIELAQEPGDRTLAAENLWVHLWQRAQPPYDRALTALIVASSYLRGDGAKARIAAGEQRVPDRLTDLILIVMQEGIEPSEVRERFGADMTQERARLRRP
ncbi:DUF4192 domain-containing protein [Amycolatopsis acidicola]|uniref:DUF4192 domain-containing protein n=1 Tax=Amycolatopsis acidicola TaxID=2596893 RepID=A0A5N0UXU4_9PSEU|nr:DUF4192 domain-containing protein [Amycolatopsis acidicola]KAA9157965.1 DUF4192 domain-containing protein [Amycolatopsis acidicola]